ncbi:hypothetical protein OTU49_017481, partial [Cherax quadricarinatus]
QHEVARLALVAGQVAQSACDGVMIDVGSGQGHLSRLLAYGHHVRVVCLEAQDQFISGAMKFDNQLEMAVEKFYRKQCVSQHFRQPLMLHVFYNPTWILTLLHRW